MKNDEEKPKKPKPTTTAIPPAILARLRDIKITEREPPYAIIERLLDEHDIKTMRKVVLKRVR